MINKLNALLSVPLEQWLTNGVSLRAASANSSGMVNSGITKDGTYFYRKHNLTNQTSEFVLG